MRENGFRAIGGLAQKLTSGMAKGRGASLVRLKADWPAVVGPELARTTRPDALLAGRGARAGKALRLKVAGAAALEVQHRSGQIVERVNAYFGHKVIDDVRIVQGVIPAPRPAPRVQRRDPAVEQAVASRTAAVEDPGLRAALTRLGARITAGRRGFLLGGLGALCVADDLRAQSSAAKFLDPQPGDHVLGRPDAPNVLIDYASFTCPHCATFNNAVMPALKRDWIDTGKLKLVHRHFPSDALATRASLLAECAGPEGFFAAVDTLFRTQVQWMTAADPAAELMTVLVGQGVSEAEAQACVANDRLLDKVIADVQSGQALGVNSTPTVFINEQGYGNPGGIDAIAAILRQVGR
ncbi:DciA family protein [Reyranella sp.]|uniref:DciA family protein n=1 Tax=Reyranella sp. TaxID=1929291 RepID=UPI0025CC18F8|nr:DciA family protein [Reyranella sp.]